MNNFSLKHFVLVTSALLFCGASLFLSVGCSKNKPPASSLLESATLQKIPPTSTGFAVWNNTTDAYKRFVKSAWGKQGGDSWMQLASGLPQHEALTKWFSSSGFFVPNPSAPNLIDEGVFFFKIGQTQGDTSIGFYFKGSDKVNLSQKLSELKAVLKKEALEVKDHKFKTASGFTLPFSQLAPPTNTAALPFTPQLLYFAADKKQLAVTTSEADANRLFQADTTGGIDTLRKTKAFQQAVAEIPASKDQLSFGYVDIRALLGILDLPLTEQLKLKKQTKLEIDKLPFTALAGSRRMGTTLSDTVAVLLNPQSQEHKDLVKRLSSPNKTALSKSAPNDMAIFISISGETLAALKNMAISSAGLPPQAQPLELFKILDQISGLGIGITNLSGSPFPGVTIMVESSNSTQLRASAKEELTGAFASIDFPLSPWQTKELDGVPVDVIMSPLGVGAMLTDVDGIVVLGSTDDVLKSAIAAIKDRSKGLHASLGAVARTQVDKAAPLLLVYANVNKVASLIEAVQGNLSMFTGGDTNAELQKQIAQLKGMGKVVWTAAVKSNAVKIEGSYESEPAKN
ncbi:hypothetical protein OAO01_00875 [Oligoflexia bacterium]|nr:hypothetical protein [Oligoflexia bacterium]